jgi:hypothetical protein
MKRMTLISAFLLSAVAASLLVPLSSASTIVREVEFPEPVITSKGGTCLVSVKDCPVYGDPGEPLLPSLPLRVLLPRGEEIANISVRVNREREIAVDHPLEWGKPQVPRGMKQVVETMTPDPEIYTSRTAFPPYRAFHVTTQTYRGYSIAFIRVYPVRYAGADGRLIFAPNVTVTIETAFSSEMLTRSAGTLREEVLHDQAGLGRVLGLDPAPGLGEQELQTLETYLSPAAAPRPLSALVDPEDSYPLVIITTAVNQPAFETLKAFKDSRGLMSRVVRVNQITPHYDGLDLQDRIRKFIRDAYLCWETEYVLLGADVGGIPHRGLYAEILPYVTDSDIPADIYYACLDGTWNDDSDGRWGEPGEDDLLPEVGIGRVCAGSLAEATAFVNKVIRYESTPVVDQIKIAQMAGELIYDEPTWGGDEKDEVKDGSSAHGFTTAGFPPSFTVHTLYDRDLYPTEWTKWDLIALLNGGRHLVNHSGHCINWMCMKISTSDIPTSFTNDGITNSYLVIYAHGCYSAAFDNRTTDGSYVDDSVGEYFTLIENGAVAYIGNSRYGCGFHGDTRAAAQYYDRQFFDAVFGEGITIIGDAQADSKIDNIPYIDFRGMRWTYYTLNLLADPSMDIWTDTPGTLSVTTPDTVFSGDNEVEIGVTSAGEPIAGARVSLVGDSTYFGHGYTDAAGLVHIDPGTLEPGPIYVAVTAHDCYASLDTLPVSAAAHPLVVLEGFSIDDDTAGSSSGNSDGRVDAGETIETRVSLRNAGLATAESLSGILRSSDPSVTLLDSSGTFADVPPGELLTPVAAFAYAVCPATPDSHLTSFRLELSYSDTVVIRRFEVMVHAPVLDIESVTVSDSLYGNGDGCAEPGETLELRLVLANHGSGDATGLAVLVSEDDEYASLGADSAAIGTVTQGGTAETSPPYLINLEGSCPVRHAVRLLVDIALASGRTAADSTVLRAGGTLEDDFESTVPGWTHSEIIPGFYDQWHIETYRNHTPGGAYCWKFGSAGGAPYVHYAHGGLVTPELCLGPNATLTFWYWIQVEMETGNYASDGGIVEISTDGCRTWTQITPVGGYPYRIYPGTSTPIPPETPCFAWTDVWTQAEFDLSAYEGPARIRFNFGGGEHFETEEGWYIDDILVTDDYASVGMDDDTAGGLPQAFAIRRVSPNPALAAMTVAFDVPEPTHASLAVFDTRGRRVAVIVEGEFNRGNHMATWKPDRRLAPGVYFIRMSAPGFGQTRKLVLLRPAGR